MPLKQTTCENIVANEEIAQNEQFLLLPLHFQLYPVNIFSFIDIFCVFAKMKSKSSTAGFFCMPYLL